MRYEPSHEELGQIIKQMEDKCLNRNQPEEIEVWERMMSNPIIDNLPAGLAYFDNDFVLKKYNRIYGDYIRKYSPYSPEEALGMCYFKLKPGISSYLEDFFRHIRDSGRGETSYDLQICNMKKGKKIGSYWDGNLTPIKDKAGRVRGVGMLCVDVTERNVVKNAFRKRGDLLTLYSHNIAELKSTLKVMLNLREEDKKMLEENILCNVKQMILPCIEKLKATQLTADQIAYLDMIKSNVNDLISPFSRVLSSEFCNLTPMEIQVVGFVKEGKTSKEIAGLLRVSKACIDFHRNNIRKKLGLNSGKKNLQTHLSILMKRSSLAPQVFNPHSPYLVCKQAVSN
jgi:DNA-binding NarL/FixJ family response regulator